MANFLPLSCDLMVVVINHRICWISVICDKIPEVKRLYCMMCT